MGKADNYKVGDTVYVYFGEKNRIHLRKGLRKEGTYFVEYLVVQVNKATDGRGQKLTMIANTRYCNKHHPYGGYGITLIASSKYVIDKEAFEKLCTEATDDNIAKFCQSIGLDEGKFKKAFKPYIDAFKRR